MSMRELVRRATALVTGRPAGIKLLVRADDMGVALNVNDACIHACTEGIVRSVEVVAPGPWFLDAVQRLHAHPEIDVGIHLCLTSEWDRVKWRPLTAAPSLVDSNGYFCPATLQLEEFPPGTGFHDANPKPDEIERELRAQIDLVRRHLPRVSHVSAHMGAATATPAARAITEGLCREYHLRLESPELSEMLGWRQTAATPEQTATNLAAAIARLEPGSHLLIEHPGLDTPEMRAMSHTGRETEFVTRAWATHALTSTQVKRAVKKRGIALISHQDLGLTLPQTAARSS